MIIQFDTQDGMQVAEVTELLESLLGGKTTTAVAENKKQVAKKKTSAPARKVEPEPEVNEDPFSDIEIQDIEGEEENEKEEAVLSIDDQGGATTTPVANIEDVKASVNAASKRLGEDAKKKIVSAMADFGVKKLSEIEDGKHHEFVTILEGLS